MNWRKVAELRYGIDETPPGFEDESTVKRYKGDEIKVALDPAWPAFPRMEIEKTNVIVETVSCVTGSGSELEVMDKTGEDEISMPPTGCMYLAKNGSSGYDTTYIYFHISRVGETVFVDYEYYPEEDRWAHLAVKDGLVYGATLAGRFYLLNDTMQRVYDIPNKPASLSNDGEWAGGRSLFRFGNRHRPAIRAIKANESPRGLAASLAISYSADLTYSPDRSLSLSNRQRTTEAVIPVESVLEIIATHQSSYEAARVTFGGGEVVSGTGRELRVNLPTIGDVGIARSIAERILRDIKARGAIFKVSAMGDYGVNAGGTLFVPGMFRGEINQIKRYLYIEKTEFEVVTPRKGDQTFD